MPERAYAVLDSLRAELSDLASATLALAAETPFRRRRDERDCLVGCFVPTFEQESRAAEHHKRLERWIAALTAIVQRRTAIDVATIKRPALELADCVLLTFVADARLVEQRWRDEYRRHTDGLFAELREILEQVVERRETITFQSFAIAIAECEERWRITSNSTEEISAIPFSTSELGRFRRKYCRPHATHSSASRQPIAAFGQALFAALFQRSIGAAYRAARDAADQEGHGLRIEISAPESAVPWELLHDGDDFLCLSPRTPVVRRVHCTTRRPPPAPQPLHRILHTLSAPDLLDDVSADVERIGIAEALAPLQCIGALRLDTAPTGTLNETRQLLRTAADSGQPYDAWHFSGHGGFDKKKARGALAVTTADGGDYDAGIDELVPLFHDHPQLQLVVLNACNSLDSAMRAFVADGAAAVIAMQSEIGDLAAVAFAQELYGALAEGASIESAVAEARRAVFFTPNTADWFAPVLFLGGQTPD